MSFLDTGGTLEDVLGQSATNQINSIDQQYAKQRRKAAAVAGASGRLTSGVQNYTMGDIGANEASDVGNVYSGLASALGQVPITDYTTTQEAQRKRQLAELIASMNKPSTLEQALGTVKTVGNLAAMAAVAA